MDGVGDVCVELPQPSQKKNIPKNSDSSSWSEHEFGVDALYPGMCKPRFVKLLWESFHILESVTIRIPEAKCPSRLQNPGETLIHPYMFQEGLRLSLHPCQHEFFVRAEIVVGQANPNVIRYVNAFFFAIRTIVVDLVSQT